MTCSENVTLTKSIPCTRRLQQIIRTRLLPRGGKEHIRSIPIRLAENEAPDDVDVRLSIGLNRLHSTKQRDHIGLELIQFLRIQKRAYSDAGTRILARLVEKAVQEGAVVPLRQRTNGAKGALQALAELVGGAQTGAVETEVMGGPWHRLLYLAQLPLFQNLLAPSMAGAEHRHDGGDVHPVEGVLIVHHSKRQCHQRQALSTAYVVQLLVHRWRPTHRLQHVALGVKALKGSAIVSVRGQTPRPFAQDQRLCSSSSAERDGTVRIGLLLQRHTVQLPVGHDEPVDGLPDGPGNHQGGGVPVLLGPLGVLHG
mmetsp:Transcript_53231/g.143532  ORF Transcript_53231/g.143532 Transcript_53231/m.143532 type:complete len:312 (-) Transcript_53231:758-1693(-)